MANAIPAAFGAVVGYIGAEVAEESIFNRLLWPQRYFNSLNSLSTVKLGLFMPTGGPLHRAALKVLDKISDNGLYNGRQRGDMLGTAFFTDNSTTLYDLHTADASEELQTRKSSRNGLWVEVMKNVARNVHNIKSIGHPGVRAIRPIFVLDLESHTGNVVESKHQVVVSEQHVTARNIFGIFISELSAIFMAVLVALWNTYGQDNQSVPPYWMIALFLAPLLLKLLAVKVTVRREGLAKQEEILTPSEKKAIFELEYPSIGVLLIRTSTHNVHTIQQFFRHYGHPIRDSKSDRRREIASIALVYAFILHFPIGLALLGWMNESTQYLWLFYQLYCVVAMHIQRVCGWQGSGRTEEAIAELLTQGKTVFLKDENACIQANLNIDFAESVAESRKIVKGIVVENAAKLEQLTLVDLHKSL